MSKFHFKSIVILLSLVITNQYSNDYNLLMSAFSRGQESFGFLFIKLSQIYNYYGFPYFAVHLTYLMILAISLASFTRNIISVVLLIILVGGILNEQTRFFSAIFIAFSLMSLNGKLRFLFPLSFFIHPAAFLISFVVFCLMNTVKKMNELTFLCCTFFAYVFGSYLVSFIVSLGNFLGYGYSGTVHLEPLSILGKIVFFVLAVYEAFIIKNEGVNGKNYDRDIIRALIILGIFASGIAIASGRIMLVLFLLVVAISPMPKIRSSQLVATSHNNILLASILSIATIFLARISKFL